MESRHPRIDAVLAAANLVQDAAGALRLMSQQMGRTADTEWWRSVVSISMRSAEQVLHVCSLLADVHGLAGLDQTRLRAACDALGKELLRVQTLSNVALETVGS